MDKVNHPNHYNKSGRKECIEEMLDEYGSTITGIFCLTNAYKYIYRAGDKEGESAKTDISKAIWYKNYYDNIKDDIVTSLDRVSNMKEIADFVEKSLNDV